MLVRIIHFVIGAVLAGGGGFLAWTERGHAPSLFPPDPAGAPWLLVAGVAGVTAGLVFLVSAVLPRPERAARLAAESARREEALKAADAFYAERARAAERDWRSGELPPVAPVVPAPSPEPAQRAAPAPEASLPRTAPASSGPIPAAPARPATAKPVATAMPPQMEVSPFPSGATLAPIPKSSDPPPAPIPAPSARPPIAPAASVGASSFEAIRTAIDEGRLDEADKLLTSEREKAQGAALAELTGLAGDHAAAAGRTSNAKWLWRLALKRFGELGAMDSPAARAVSERLRLADQ
jgi:hypothetical protein